jgi:1-phosphatidylinositol-4-phosphate 5-kinase
MRNYEPVYLMMMGNTLKFKQKDKVRRIYDLKGSRVARNVDTRNAKSTTTLKDINFFDNQSREQEINLDPADAKKLKSLLKKDSQLLMSLGIMDYSLLLGIEKYPTMATTPNMRGVTMASG